MAVTAINVRSVNDSVDRSLKEIDAQEASLRQASDVFATMQSAWDSETQNIYSEKFKKSRAEIDGFNQTQKEYFQTTKKFVDDLVATDSLVSRMLSGVKW